MAKEIQNVVKLQVPAGQANPAPPIGPVLGQAGVNIMDFCKQFNAKTQKQAGDILPVVLTVYKDRSFTFELKQPPMSFLILQAMNKKKGSGVPNREKIGKITMSQVREIAQRKMPDLNTTDIDSACNTVMGSCRSMGVDVVEA
ncbi:MAG: 50S ribosomal protein L11 [Bdellovibrionales bacterium]|nr:50S ribosomal protein L11 [Bdellovibrionales bacterium]